MNLRHGPGERDVRGFRWKLLAALMVVICGLTGLGLYLAQRTTAANAAEELQRSFRAEIASLHKLQDLRHTALVERCRVLAAKPRIHAALEDNALDLLYPSAKDELRDLMKSDTDATAGSLDAKFYRFLDDSGSVLRAQIPEEVGTLSADEEARLSLKKLPESQQIGYLPRIEPNGNSVDEVTAVPIFSTETGEVISALVVGFAPLPVGSSAAGTGMRSGIYVNAVLYMPGLSGSERESLARQLSSVIQNNAKMENNFTVTVGGAPHLLFYKQLNVNSMFPSAYEVCMYPLAPSLGKLHRLRWQIAGSGALLLLAGFGASQWAALRLAEPVERLAIDSATDRAERARAEAALATTAEELERSSRYSADASHQLKSPVTLLRTGLEWLLGRDGFTPDIYEELSSLLHQTHRLTGVIDDLLLLSRMDAGHLQIDCRPVNLSQLVEEWIDDLEALPDAPDVRIQKNLPAELYVAGEKQYTSLIVQNLLENARKYNRVGGRIEVTAAVQNGEVVLTIGNTGRPIPAAARARIFERFHRNSETGAGSGHGLGLNLARELVRLHGGTLRLIGSREDWTEFQARFRAADPGAA